MAESAKSANYLLIASMDVEPDREALFNEVYDREHVPSLGQVPGVLAIARYERVELTMSIGGELRKIESDAPRYHALYELERPEVLTGTGWAEAVEQGRWPAEVRPYTTNRRHLLLRRLP
jgi:hypothetical protein